MQKPVQLRQMVNDLQVEIQAEEKAKAEEADKEQADAK
jgi:hypothetical protein